ncbi:Membrane protein insertion efficiency factor YidD [hydrothermal vent metagenome]|uniref:Membrane protein insertion efficiency factor YidD n=1 Tax=hydrothermal vent metagenome TaxID=652676 RepID=A0A3B0VD28_9ZZZZ
MKFILIQLLKGYKYFISPLFGARCRFYPSCSEYMMTAIERFGIIKGMGMGIKRISRCHPACEGGIDHVPELDKTKQKCEQNHDD